MKTVSKRRPHPPAYERETLLINENKKKPEASKVHKFKPAKWTHPNGHPRCLVCGDEERIGGMCNKEPTAEEHRKFQIELDAEFSKAYDDIEKHGHESDPLYRVLYHPHHRGFNGREERTSASVHGRNRIVRPRRGEGAAALERRRQQRAEETSRMRRVAQENAEQHGVSRRGSRRPDSPVDIEDAFSHGTPTESQRGDKTPKRIAQRKQKDGSVKAIVVPARPRIIRNRKKVTPGQEEAVELPGPAPLHLRNQALDYARENYPKQKEKYAGLIVRLAGKGKAQDPRFRGDQSKKYGIDLQDLFDIEREMLEIMYPKEHKRERESASVRLADMSEVQRGAIRAHGGLSAFVMEDDSTRIFKANKGPHRGSYVEVTANGSLNPLHTNVAKKRIAAAKKFWQTKAEKERRNPRRWVHEPFINMAGKRDVKSKLVPLDEWEREVKRIRETHEALDDQKKAIKEAKIKIAQQWAESHGYDPEDSYWWGYYWSDPSLIKNQDEPADDSKVQPVTPNHPTPRERRKGKKIDLPAAETTQREMRGHRPGPRRDVYNRDNVEREDELKQMLDEIRAEAEKSTKKSKKSSSRAKRKIVKIDPMRYIEKTEVVISKLPRNVPGHVYHFKHGWIPLTHPAAGEAKVGRRKSGGNWDHTAKDVAQGVEIKRLPHKGMHAPLGPDGKTIARKKMLPGQALYARNNGATKISDKRLAEISKDRTLITPAERDLLMSAGAQEHLDGMHDVKVWVVRDKSMKPRPRAHIIRDLRNAIGNDAHRNAKGSRRGVGGHVVRRLDIPEEQKKKENAKRVASGRNVWANKKGRQAIAERFSEDGVNCVCIFCGEHVLNEAISPERMKPGPLGGKYELENMAPAHETCNTLHGEIAQKSPKEYYEDMMRWFLKRYSKKLRGTKLRDIHRRNRKHLGPAPTVATSRRSAA